MRVLEKFAEGANSVMKVAVRETSRCASKMEAQDEELAALHMAVHQLQHGGVAGHAYGFSSRTGLAAKKVTTVEEDGMTGLELETIGTLREMQVQQQLRR